MDIIIVMKIIASAILIYCFSFLTLVGKDWDQIEGKIQNHADSMADACVSIRAENGAWGSGVIVSRSGMIFSAAHVYQSPGEMVTVFLGGEKTAQATVVRLDRKYDIAVLEMDRPTEIEPAKMVRRSGIETGSTLIAAGHASGFNAERRSPLRVGFGFLASEKGLIYTTCRITAGDSGGPLFDDSGVLRGIHHTMDGSGKFSAHIPVQRFFQLWPELAISMATVS